MKIIINKYIVILLLVIWLLTSAAMIMKFYYFASYSNLIFSTESRNNTPAGELLANSKLEQQITLTENINNSDFCLDILLATYMRVNKSRVSFKLVQSDRIYEKVITSTEIIDNSYHKICFQNVTLNKGFAMFIVEGIDGKPGDSITAWLTDDLKNGQVKINGIMQDKSLVINARQPIRGVWFAESPKYLIFIMTYVIFILLVTFLYANKKE